MNDIIITAIVGGSVRTWRVAPKDAETISAVLFDASEATGNPAIGNAMYIFRTNEHETIIADLA